MLLLGYIKEISAKEIIVGLPNGLNGYIKTSDVRLKLEKLAFDDESDDDEEDEEGEVVLHFFFTPSLSFIMLVETQFQLSI